MAKQEGSAGRPATEPTRPKAAWEMTPEELSSARKAYHEKRMDLVYKYADEIWNLKGSSSTGTGRETAQALRAAYKALTDLESNPGQPNYSTRRDAATAHIYGRLEEWLEATGRIKELYPKEG